MPTKFDDLLKPYDIEIPLWFKKILYAKSIDLIAVKGEAYQGLNYDTLTNDKYSKIVDIINKIIKNEDDTAKWEDLQGFYIFAIDSRTKKFLGYEHLTFNEENKVLELAYLSSVGYAYIDTQENTEFNLIGSILMTTASIACVIKNNPSEKPYCLKWESVRDSTKFYGKFVEFGVTKISDTNDAYSDENSDENSDETHNYFFQTKPIKSTEEAIPPKKYYIKYFPELKNTRKPSDVFNTNCLFLSSSRENMFNTNQKIMGGRINIADDECVYNQVLMLDADENQTDPLDLFDNNKISENTIVMHKKGNFLTVYWNKGNMARTLNINQKTNSIIKSLEENNNIITDHNEIRRIAQIFGCVSTNNNYNRNYRDMKNSFDMIQKNSMRRK